MNSAAGVPLVLVVDDDATVRALFASFLRRAGIDVDLACDGADAVGRLRQRVPDAVVCDLEMPNMDGLAFCQRLRDAATRVMPVVIVSGGGVLALGRAREAGCDAVLAKPCSGAVLARLLDRAPTSSIHVTAPDAREVAIAVGGASPHHA